jgi:hypothetical protein
MNQSHPSSPPDLLSRAIALHRAGNLIDAETHYRKLLSSNPKHPHALTLLGTIHAQRGDLEEGIRLMTKAITVKPDHSEAYFNRALSLQNLGRYEDALKDFDKATLIDSSYAEAFWHKSLLQLTLGQYEEGWKLYEWRWKSATPFEFGVLQEILWLGKEPLAGKTIMLHAEQGMGDIIQLCRYAPLVEALGAKVILRVPASLTKLLSSLKGSFHIISEDEPLPKFDLHCPLFSLPLAFGTTLETIPADVPYLSADPDRRDVWQKRLGKRIKPRIGLVWSGNAKHKNDHNRSIPLKLLASLSQENYEFHSIQNECKPLDAQTLEHQNCIISHAENLKDFADTAALISEMDLIISVDTSVAHLAGALGKRVWIVLPFIPDFRWLTEREDSPWYPTARLFRQPHHNDWASVIEKIKATLTLSDGHIL